MQIFRWHVVFPILNSVFTYYVYNPTYTKTAKRLCRRYSVTQHMGVLYFFKKMGHSRPLFHLFHLKQKLQFLQQINVKNVHTVYSAGIQTHNLQDTSLLLKPLDHGSTLSFLSFLWKVCSIKMTKMMTRSNQPTMPHPSWAQCCKTSADFHSWNTQQLLPIEIVVYA